jgi:hypothetical protein
MIVLAPNLTEKSPFLRAPLAAALCLLALSFALRTSTTMPTLSYGKDWLLF